MDYKEKKNIDFLVLQGVEGLIGEIIVKILFGVEAIDTKVRGKPFSKALAEYTI